MKTVLHAEDAFRRDQNRSVGALGGDVRVLSKTLDRTESALRGNVVCHYVTGHSLFRLELPGTWIARPLHRAGSSDTERSGIEGMPGTKGAMARWAQFSEFGKEDSP